MSFLRGGFVTTGEHNAARFRTTVATAIRDGVEQADLGRRAAGNDVFELGKSMSARNALLDVARALAKGEPDADEFLRLCGFAKKR